MPVRKIARLCLDNDGKCIVETATTCPGQPERTADWTFEAIYETEHDAELAVRDFMDRQAEEIKDTEPLRKSRPRWRGHVFEKRGGKGGRRMRIAIFS